MLTTETAFGGGSPMAWWMFWGPIMRPIFWRKKTKSYPASPSGMPGVQTLVPIMLDHVHAGRLTLERFVDLTSHGPNRLFGLAGKGRLAVGYEADFTIVDLKARRTITNDWSASKSGWTPFHGREVTGWPKGTIIRGRRVMWEDELLGDAQGAPMRFQETYRPYCKLRSKLAWRNSRALIMPVVANCTECNGPSKFSSQKVRKFLQYRGISVPRSSSSAKYSFVKQQGDPAYDKGSLPLSTGSHASPNRNA